MTTNTQVHRINVTGKFNANLKQNFISYRRRTRITHSDRYCRTVMGGAVDWQRIFETILINTYQFHCNAGDYVNRYWTFVEAQSSTGSVRFHTGNGWLFGRCFSRFPFPSLFIYLFSPNYLINVVAQEPSYVG